MPRGKSSMPECGRGGTAAYMQNHGWGRVTGIDIEPKSIEYARETSPRRRSCVATSSMSAPACRPVRRGHPLQRPLRLAGSGCQVARPRRARES
ncbi:MAG: class I SAM-dependent methyltransferase [Hyphomicrobium sp.]